MWDRPIVPGDQPLDPIVSGSIVKKYLAIPRVAVSR